MATRKIDLGTVGFGLEANTASLAASLRTLKVFGEQVNKIGNTSGWADPLFKKFSQIERVLTTIHGQVGRTTQRMRDAGVAAKEIDKIEQAYRRLSRTLTHQAHGLGPQEIARGVGGMRSMLAQGNRLASASEVNKVASAFRELERAAILAVGPLSGIGARLAVLSALFETTSAKMALFIAGMTGLIASFTLAAVGGVKATMDMERFNATLEAATGSASLVAAEYDRVLQMSNKLGQNVRSLVEPYAKFMTAARLSNLALDDQRKIFEGAMVAGTAMRLSNERMNLVFLALEQMVSKGTVSMEELRRQLGDLLPGSMALAAQAMGKTEAELIKMVEAGEVLAKDLLPLLGQKWMDVFGPAAARAAQSLQSELNRLRTQFFETLKAFDAATLVSDGFRSAVILTREAMELLASNMREVVAFLGAIGGFTAAYILTLINWAGVIRGLAAAYVALRAAIIAADLAAATSLVGGLVTTLLRLSVGLAGAAAGYFLLHKEQQPIVETSKEWIKVTSEQITMQERLGKAHRQTTQQMIVDVAEKIMAMNTEMAALEAQIAHRESVLSALPGNKVKRRFSFDPVNPANLPNTTNDPIILAMRARRDEMKRLLEEMFVQMERLKGLKVQDAPKPDDMGGTAFQNWVKSIQQSIREAEGLESQIKASEFGKDAMVRAEAMAKALEKMADIPDKKRGGLAAIEDQLRKAGYEGANLTEKLANLFTVIEQRKQTLKDIENFPQAFKEASESAAKMFDELIARRNAAETSDPQNMSSQERLAKALVTLRGHYAKMKLDQEVINRQVQEYTTLWNQTERIEANSKRVKELRDELERLDDTLGDSNEKATKKFLNNMQLINEMQDRGVIGAVRAAQLTRSVYDEMYRHILDRSTLFGRSMQEMFRDLERNLSRTLAQLTLRQKVSFRDLLTAMAQQVLEFAYQVSLVQPLMKGLFGGLYTRNSADAGSGLFEGGLLAMGRAFGFGMAGSPDAGQMGLGPYGGFDASALELTNLYDTMYMGGFASGGSFTVGGNGGVDSQLVAFHATPGERVSVSNSDAASKVQVIVNNNTGMPIDTELRSGPDPETVIVDMFFRHMSRNAGSRQQLQSMMSRPRH